MSEKLFDSEAKVMDIIWEKGPLSAKEISLIAAESIGWNKNTTYTVIKKLEAKGFIRRDEPGFICTPLVTRGEVQKQETESLINRRFQKGTVLCVDRQRGSHGRAGRRTSETY